MKSRIESFRHALRGCRTLLATQPHGRFHVVAGLAVFGVACLCRVTATEWALLILCIMAVWIAEAINTAIEFLADEVSLDWRERIKHAKDISAFAVLIAATGSTMIGIIILFPYILKEMK
ncbi:MAG: diacylglycerol kinase family protein [Verrucomicrobiota bacterium]